MHFYEIVDISDIFSQMAYDKNNERISRAFTELLIDSFFPNKDESNITDKELIDRCITFIQENPHAAQVFYKNIHQFASIGTIAKFLVILFTYFLASNKSKKGKENTDLNSGSRTKRGRSKMVFEFYSLKLKYLLFKIIYSSYI